MSEYQYYEFQAIDRPLNAKEMARLRSVSTRARITPTSFVNEYDYGNFKGDEDAWMDQYFDAFLYFANWGTRVLKLRLSSRLLELATAKLYCGSDSASAREHEGKTILTFNSDEDEDEWPEEEDALSVLVPIRAQLAQGDLRSLYIGWLRAAEAELEDDKTEPPVPPGLGQLDGSLTRLIDFLRVDPVLVEVAAAASPPLAPRTLTREAIRTWIASRPATEKDDYLERFVVGKEPALAAELQRLVGDRNVAAPASSEPRTVGELLRAAQDAWEKRRRAAAERAEIERKRREEEAAATRSKYLEGVARREPAVWTEIDKLIATKLPASYDRAISLLVDLRDIAVRTGDEPRFLRGLEHLQMEHARKPALLLRMKKAGLPNPSEGPLLT